jgi:hypothetical protein
LAQERWGLLTLLMVVTTAIGTSTITLGMLWLAGYWYAKRVGWVSNFLAGEGLSQGNSFSSAHQELKIS